MNGKRSEILKLSKTKAKSKPNGLLRAVIGTVR